MAQDDYNKQPQKKQDLLEDVKDQAEGIFDVIKKFFKGLFRKIKNLF
jgi:hypothetical protein